jgi:predicted PurR-regulated permease PerM
MNFLDRRTAHKFLTLVFLALLLAAIYCARQIILLFFIAILFAYLLDPMVRLLQRHSLFFKDLRGPAVVEVYLALLILIALGLHGAAPGLTREPVKLAQSVPALLDGLSNGEVPKGMGSNYGWSDVQALRVTTLLARHRQDIQKLVTEAEQVAPSIIGGLVLIPILAIFFLRDGRRIANGFIRLAAHWGKYEDIQSLAEEVNTTLRKYIRTKVTLAGLSLACYCAVMLLLRFPHPLALGFLGAALEFIPVAGWMTAAATIISVGVLTQSHWIWMAALLGIWRITQSYVNAPRIMGRQLEIHPLMSIFGVMVGWEIGGIIGVYFSVPLMAVIGVIWRRLIHAHGETKKPSTPSLVAPLT